MRRVGWWGSAATRVGVAVDDATSRGDDPDRAASAADHSTNNTEAITAPDDGEPVPMSLDRDASDRSFDRQLAYLGLLDDAAPLFREGTQLLVSASSSLSRA
jgi:hypothetical protein